MKKTMYSLVILAALVTPSVLVAQNPPPKDKKDAYWVRNKKGRGNATGVTRGSGNQPGDNGAAVSGARNSGATGAGNAGATAGGSNTAGDNANQAGAGSQGGTYSGRHRHGRRHHAKS